MSTAPSKNRTFNVGTRNSKLALAQTDMVVEALGKAWPGQQFNIRPRDTAAGDLDKVTPFKDMPVKNLWTHDLEEQLAEGKMDLLVQCLKGKSIYLGMK
jgi:hydroxymethylbilane synthase